MGVPKRKMSKMRLRTRKAANAWKSPGLYVDPKTGANKTVYAFEGGTDGWLPYAGVIAVKGALYGTTGAGGTGPCDQGCGTVFSINPSTDAETILHDFQGGSDGELSVAGLIAKAGKLYGTTNLGGDANNDGTVFEISP